MGQNPHAFCGYCGTKMLQQKEADESIMCAVCGGIVYFNPIPVAVLIAPCGNLEPPGSVFAIRRGIEPFKGELALPGGYIAENEIWEAAAAREAREELGLHCRYNHSPMERPYHILTKSSDEGNRLLVVGAVNGIFHVAPFEPSEEAIERVVYTPDSAEQLCFPIHRQALAMYWDKLDIPHRIPLD